MNRPALTLQPKALLGAVAVIAALAASALAAIPDGDAASSPVAVAAAQTAADWPQFQHDAKRTGHNTAALSGPFTQKWTRDLGTPIADRVQPVIADGILVVGGVNGTAYGLNASTGAIVWTYATGGPIVQAAAIEAGRVYVGSQDGYLYALNLADGAFVWRVKVGARPIGGAPLVYNNRIYVAGKDGLLYALNAGDGSLAWQVDTANTTPPSTRAPILSSPSVSPTKNRIFFAAENLKAYALDAATGSLAWTYQMYGESAYETWPVVSESNGVVLFQTKSVYSFHASLGLDDGDLFCPGRQGTGCGSCAADNPESFNAPNQVVLPGTAQWDEQHAPTNSIDWILGTWPQRRTLYALNLDTGALIPAPILWTGGGGRPNIAPVVNETTGDVYLPARTKWSRRDGQYFCRKWIDIVRLTFTTARGTFHFIPCASGTNCPDSWSFHLIGDETTALALGGNTLIGTGWFHTGSLRVDNGAYFPVSNLAPEPEGKSGSGGDHAAPAAIANQVVYVKQRAASSAESAPFTRIVAYQGQ